MGKNFSKPREKKEFLEELIDLARVTRVVKGGRRMRFRATVVIGNRKGKVGLGVGKSGEVATAVQKAVAHAKKNLLEFPIVNGTIAHSLKHKFKGARLLLMPAGPGTGIISGGATRKILDLMGVENILSKRFGSTNKLTNAQATMEALNIIAGRTSKADVERAKKEQEAKNKKIEEERVKRGKEEKANHKTDDKKKPFKKTFKKETKKEEVKEVKKEEEKIEKTEEKKEVEKDEKEEVKK